MLVTNTRYPYKFGAATFLKGNFADHEAGESQLRASDLNWTTIHPGPLMNSPRTPHPFVRDAASGIKLPGAPRTNRQDVAAVMLAAINDPKTFRKQLVMTSAWQD
ncbi:SDR family oxidoreductase [Lapidilactobacillus luobeiensis]|uniref:SDR family oxidoreductase n=1 Tax=Lapidilactobacillus luobeiensis TaxID=2950371 RepID=UPI0021C4C37F